MARGKKKNAHKRRAKQRRKQRHNTMSNSSEQGGGSEGSMSDDGSMDSILLHLGITSAAVFYRQNTLEDTEDIDHPLMSRMNSIQPKSSQPAKPIKKSPKETSNCKKAC